MVTINSPIRSASGNVTLSASACANGARYPFPLKAPRPVRESGDFANTASGRARRDARRRKAVFRWAALEV